MDLESGACVDCSLNVLLPIQRRQLRFRIIAMPTDLNSLLLKLLLCYPEYLFIVTPIEVVALQNRDLLTNLLIKL